jgi:hypothetical protein
MPSADDVPARRRPGWATGRATPGGSHVHHPPIVGGGGQLCPCSLAPGTPQAFPVASSTDGYTRCWSRPPCGGRALRAGPYPPDLSRCLNLRGVDADFSRAPSRLACRTRTVWRCQPVPSLSGLLPPSRASPRSGCPQLQPGCCDSPAAESFHLRSDRWRLVAHAGFYPRLFGEHRVEPVERPRRSPPPVHGLTTIPKRKDDMCRDPLRLKHIWCAGAFK